MIVEQRRKMEERVANRRLEVVKKELKKKNREKA